MNNAVFVVGRLEKLYNDAFVVRVPDCVDTNKEPTSIKVIATVNLMERVQEYVAINDIVGVKGHLVNDIDSTLVVFCDKFTCLSNKHGTETEEGGETDEHI